MDLVFASNNQNKIIEIQNLVSKNFKILSLSDIGCYEDIPETGSTIEENAYLKAIYIAKKYNLNCFADDSGLEIEALHGEPGVFSARYAGVPKNDQNNIDKVLQKLENIPNRSANFKTVICLIIDNQVHYFEGKVFGTIISEMRGNNGFGYDPIFVPDNYNKTFAEMSLEEKSKISHRAIAVQKLTTFLQK